MWRLLLIVALTVTLSCFGSAQWHMQDSNTSADLRGIHSIGSGIAWASGTKGTVLRTTDDGDHWQLCATPSGAEGLDFRGVQAFDANTAIIMSSGKGTLLSFSLSAQFSIETGPLTMSRRYRKHRNIRRLFSNSHANSVVGF